MPIGIWGTGLVGRTLASGLASPGYDVMDRTGQHSIREGK